MNPKNPAQMDAEDSTCFFCGKEIADGHWFARIKQGAERVIFCRPRCVEAFLDQSQEGTQRLRTAMDGRANGSG